MKKVKKYYPGVNGLTSSTGAITDPSAFSTGKFLFPEQKTLGNIVDNKVMSQDYFDKNKPSFMDKAGDFIGNYGNLIGDVSGNIAMLINANKKQDPTGRPYKKGTKLIKYQDGEREMSLEEQATMLPEDIVSPENVLSRKDRLIQKLPKFIQRNFAKKSFEKIGSFEKQISEAKKLLGIKENDKLTINDENRIARQLLKLKNQNPKFDPSLISNIDEELTINNDDMFPTQGDISQKNLYSNTLPESERRKLLKYHSDKEKQLAVDRVSAMGENIKYMNPKTTFSISATPEPVKPAPSSVETPKKLSRREKKKENEKLFKMATKTDIEFLQPKTISDITNRIASEASANMPLKVKPVDVPNTANIPLPKEERKPLVKMRKPKTKVQGEKWTDAQWKKFYEERKAELGGGNQPMDLTGPMRYANQKQRELDRIKQESLNSESLKGAKASIKNKPLIKKKAGKELTIADYEKGRNAAQATLNIAGPAFFRNLPIVAPSANLLAKLDKFLQN